MENHVCPCPNYQFAVSASEVTTLWRYTNLFIIIIIIIFLAHQHKACRQLKIKQEILLLLLLAT